MNGLALFVTLCLLYFSTLLIKRMLIIDSIAAFEVLQERGEMWIFDFFFGLQYLAVPVFLGWKFTLTAFSLWVGCFMFGYKLTFKQLWKLTMIGELIFLIPEFLKIIWFTLFQSDYGYDQYIAFYPFSLINLMDSSLISGRWLYPLKAINLFELIYWLFFISGIFWLSGKKLKNTVLIVATSYVLFFFIWIGFYLLVYK